MGIFEGMLKDNESLFRDEIALDYDFLPKLLPYREKEQKYIATCIQPLLSRRNGKNILVHGAPGIGKTAAIRHILRDLEHETEDVIPIYVNCWKKNTLHKILLEICDILDYKFTQNKRTDELFEIIKGIVNKKSAVFVFDESDKLENLDVLYMVLEEIFRKTIILITNYKSWFDNLDERLKSRLTLELLEFKPYNETETKGILKKRMEYAFVPDVWEEDAFEKIAKKTAEIEDIRSGLYLMRESGLVAENYASRKINLKYVDEALSKLQESSTRKKEEVTDDDTKVILGLIKDNPNIKSGDLHKLYGAKGGSLSYKSFMRRIKNLEKGNFVSLTKTAGGLEGNTTLIKLKGMNKKLDDFNQ